MNTLLILLAAAMQPWLPPGEANFDGTAWVFASVQHSEWCPAGNVRLDLRTGRYELTNRAPRMTCGGIAIQRPVTTGRIDRARLGEARAAYARVMMEGLSRGECRDGRTPGDIIVSNGGPRILVVTTGAGSATAPDRPVCWSPAASGLHQAVSDLFPPPFMQR